MGNKNTKSSLRNAIVKLSISADAIQTNDDRFWEQIWSEDPARAADIIKSIRTQEIRMLRDGSARNFAILTYKMVERLSAATETLCNTPGHQNSIINAARILIRILPCMFEDRAWATFFLDNHIEAPAETNAIIGPKLSYPNKSDHERDYTSYLPNRAAISSQSTPEPATNLSQLNDDRQVTRRGDDQRRPLEASSLIRALILSVCDLLFCPEFTVPSHSSYGSYLSNAVDGPPEDLKSLATCDYVWEPGVGFDSSVNSTTHYDKSRSVLLRLLLTCLSTTLYETPSGCVSHRNRWIEVLVSKENRHALPLFTSLLNAVFSYSPAKMLPFNHLFFDDIRKELVELATQILISTLDYTSNETATGTPANTDKETGSTDGNLFIEYISRIHRSEDFTFILRGMIRLLNARLEQGYLIGSSRDINFEQELLILNWKLCNLNEKYISHLLKTKDVLDIVIPILYHLNENFQDSSKSALIHIGVFNLLILSGERNFGVGLNKAYVASTLIDLPVFTGSYADLMIIVFHKLILYGYNLNQLFDFLLTIIVNISPYLKSLSMMASNCLIQLFEIFSSSSVVFTEPNYHQLVIFLLEIFNNIIQYQFDGNSNMIYAIINKRDIFLNLANMPTSQTSIQRVLKRLIRIKHDHLAKFGVPPNEKTKPMGATGDSASRNQSAASEATDSEVRGISLLATPDISDVTHPTNPNFQPNLQRELSAKNDSKQQGRQDETSEEKGNHLSLDDILNQFSGGEPVDFSRESPMISLDEAEDSYPVKQDDSMASLIVLDKSETGSKELETGSEAPAEDSQVANDVTPTDTGLLSVTTTKDDNSTERSDAEKQLPLWRPTSKWLRDWKQSLPLQTILRMIDVLVPQVEKLAKDNSGQRNELEIIQFLQNGTLVGLLPVPHPILIRKYHTNEETTLWFRVCTWGVIYHRNPIWSGTEVKLIKLTVTP